MNREKVLFIYIFVEKRYKNIHIRGVFNQSERAIDRTLFLTWLLLEVSLRRLPKDRNDVNRVFLMIDCAPSFVVGHRCYRRLCLRLHVNPSVRDGGCCLKEYLPEHSRLGHQSDSRSTINEAT